MFDDALQRLEAEHLRRRLRVVEDGPGPVVRIDGRPVVLMASNDYLGLATHPNLKLAATSAIERYGVGAGASRLISGTLPPHANLEEALARFKETEAALVFGSGYLANLGIIPALIPADGLVLADRLCHASLIDGCRLSGAEFRVYRHGDLDHLSRLLTRRTARRSILIVTDGVFSMDGDLAPLPELLQLAERYGARLLVDDAHGTGVMGATGRGLPEHFGIHAELPFHMGTLSKALGTSGAYVVGTRSLIEYVLNTVRSFLFTTAPPPAVMAAAQAALGLIQAEPERRARLWANREWFHKALTALGFRTTDTVTPIIPVLVGNPDTATQVAARLLELGVYAPAIRPPTVPKGTSRIRTTVTSEHSPAELEAAVAAFETAGRELRLI